MLRAMGIADETRLADAVADAGLEMARGAEPSAAVAKAAMARGLGMEFAKRACELTNIRLTTDHLESNRGDGATRSASFPLADAGEVVKLAAAAPGEAKSAYVNAVYRDYASVEPGGASYPEFLSWPVPPSELELLQREIDETRAKVAMVEDHAVNKEADLIGAEAGLESAIEGFVGRMSRPGAYDFACCAKEAIMRHGDGVKPVLLALGDRINQFAPRRETHLAKAAASDFDRVLAAAKRRGEKVAELGRARKAGEGGRRKLAGLEERIRVEAHSGAVREKLAAVAAENQKREEDTPEAYRPGASFLNRLRDIRRRSAMARMMADPVVGSGEYTPDELNDAYTAVVGLVPAVADNHALLIPQMRQYLESSGDRMGRVAAPQEVGLMASTVSSLDTANRNLENALGGLGKDII